MMTLIIMRLFHYAECHCAECRDLFIIVLNVVMLRVVQLNVVMLRVDQLNVVKLRVVQLNVVMLRVNQLNVIMLRVVQLNVVTQSVVVPFYPMGSKLACKSISQPQGWSLKVSSSLACFITNIDQGGCKKRSSLLHFSKSCCCKTFCC